ncbi:DNA/RNA non-specific endonuclease [Mesorhizobium sp. M1006]|uniref:DNA/RNA non-specific endonuclease n=1 Tax=Mesorhizobium sp. M1006 TaxID=2957048 RepID=UPI00333B7296
MARPELIIPYDPGFLGDGFRVPMPTLSEGARARAVGSGQVFDYTHYSLVMDRDRRTAMLTANNIDAAHKVQIGGGLTWMMDERLGEDQLGRETYDHNQIDKGHLVRREDVLWGTVAEARAANKATYFYSNASPQHKNFNQDEWRAIEDWVLERATDLSYRLCVFTGPVFTDSDPTLAELPPELRSVSRAAQLPAAFWKVIVLRDAEAGGDDLSAIAFAIKQSEAWNDLHGRRLLDLKVHQVTMAAIEAWTGLDFGVLKEVDELAADQVRTRSVTDGDVWPTVEVASDIKWSGNERRARGLRAAREASRTRSTAAEPSQARCCGHKAFDAEAAIAALSADMARLVDSVAMQADRPAARAPRTVGGPRSVVADDDAAEDPHVAAMVDAAPPALRDQVRAFSRSVAEQGQVARGERLPASARENSRVIGGGLVPPGAFLHCVCIGTPSWGCTGVLVAPQVVLTAAHCGGAISRIMVGGTMVLPQLSADARVVSVRRVTVHPNYSAHPRNENDITVVILDAPALVPPAPFATPAEIGAAAAFEIVGFGYNDPMRPLGLGTKRRVTIDLPAIMAPTPGEALGGLPAMLGFNPDYEFVAGRKMLGKDSCNGDSGGPAYVSVGGVFKLAGLTSRATRAATMNCGDGGIYVRPDRFRDWINSTVTAAGLLPLVD